MSAGRGHVQTSTLFESSAKLLYACAVVGTCRCWRLEAPASAEIQWAGEFAMSLTQLTSLFTPHCQATPLRAPSLDLRR
jgi:hypothetical protein